MRDWAKIALNWFFAASEKKCNAWHDLLEVMPAMCNLDYAAMELLHARLVRTTTCADGCKCDYIICGDRDEYLKEPPEYVDEAGFRRNI